MTQPRVITRQNTHLPSFFLLFFLGEDGVHPPDFGEHAAIAKAKTQTQEPKPSLEEGWGKRIVRKQ